MGRDFEIGREAVQVVAVPQCEVVELLGVDQQLGCVFVGALFRRALNRRWLMK